MIIGSVFNLCKASSYAPSIVMNHQYALLMDSHQSLEGRREGEKIETVRESRGAEGEKD